MNGINKVTTFVNQRENEFCNFRGFFPATLLRAHHVTGANKRAGEIKIEDEYMGDIDQSVVDPVFN